MHFYGIPYKEMLALPMHTFWEMSRSVDRIQAHDDLRMFRLVQQAVWGEEPQEYLEDLQKERGLVAEGEAAREGECDRRGLDQLRAMVGCVGSARDS